MEKKVAIVGYAQSRHQYEMPKSREDMVFDVVREAIDHAGIKRDVVVIGVSDRIEVWSRENYKEFYDQSKDSYEEIAEKLFKEE